MNTDENKQWDAYTVVFKALSDRTRLKIMWLLMFIDSKISASEIIDVLEENQYNVSKHLKVLKNAGLIYEKREGRWTFYHYENCNNEFHKSIKSTVSTISAGLMNDEIERCQKRLSMRVNGVCIVGADSKEWNSIKK
ncbi:MAG: metalloregulator ArsR/SmtB family transcription factor [Spirochaetales bacterium]|nr:metalloregulator ArsR/SmtB family transcription factor [Spirochaetales bacterium]